MNLIGIILHFFIHVNFITLNFCEFKALKSNSAREILNTITIHSVSSNMLRAAVLGFFVTSASASLSKNTLWDTTCVQ